MASCIGLMWLLRIENSIQGVLLGWRNKLISVTNCCITKNPNLEVWNNDLLFVVILFEVVWLVFPLVSPELTHAASLSWSSVGTAGSLTPYALLLGYDKLKAFFQDSKRDWMAQVLPLEVNVIHHISFSQNSGNPLQYSCLANPMDGGAWWAAVHGVTRSWTWLSDFTLFFHFHALEKEMATPLQCSYLGNPRDWEAWWAAIYGVTQSRTQLKWLSSSSSSSHRSNPFKE